MNTRKVWKENDLIYSENITEIDNSKNEGGVLKFTRKLEMNKVEAKRQYLYITTSLTRAEMEADSLKSSLTREGLIKYQDEQRKKLKSVKEQIEEFNDLKKQYENVGINEKAELQHKDV